MRGRVRGLDLHLGHFELGTLQPLAEGHQAGAARGRAGQRPQAVVVHVVLNGLEAKLESGR